MITQKSMHQQNIEILMEGAKQKIPSKPTIPDKKVRELRARLILEEALETIDALGIAVSVNGSIADYQNFKFTHYKKEIDLAEIADGCADISVVTIGTLSACGIADLPILREVDKNNIAKVGPGSHIDKHGKLVKPPNHPKPDLKTIIERMKENV